MNNVCEHCRAGYLGEMWRLEIGEEHLAFCGLDCLYNWSVSEWTTAVEVAREPRGAVGHFGTQILAANR